MKITVQGAIQSVLGIAAVTALIGGGFLAVGFRMETPADVQESHIEEFHDHTQNFEGHVAHFDTFLVRYDATETSKDASRAARTRMVEAQTRLTCLRTGLDTLAMLNLVSVCDSLGVRR